jgi:hypothetical protein
MVDATPKSRGKRRRTIVAILLLLMTVAIGWWHWPRGNQWFAGNWRDSDPDWEHPATVRLWHFARNGSGSISSPGRTTLFRWRAEGDRLQIGYSPSIVKDVLDAIARLNPTSVIYTFKPFHEYQFVRHGDREIFMKDSFGQYRVLTRSP